MYFMARHTSIDCLEKRGRRGYLFLIGDELAYPRVKARELRHIIGVPRPENVDTTAIVAELRRKYDVYFVIPSGACHAGDRSLLDYWRGHFGQNVLRLDDLDAACETIALTIGLGEQAIDLDEGIEHLREFGSGAGPSVSRALARLGGPSGSTGRRVVTGARARAALEAGRGGRSGEHDGRGARR
jgi:hypothetical protein